MRKFKVKCLAICCHGNTYRVGTELTENHIDDVEKRLKDGAIVELEVKKVAKKTTKKTDKSE